MKASFWVTLALLTGGPVAACQAVLGEEVSDGQPDREGVVRDCLWVWGNPEMATGGKHTLATFAQASSAERARLLGVPNVALCGTGLPNDDDEAEILTIHNDAKAVSWTANWIKRVGDQKLRPPSTRGQPHGERSTQRLPADWPSWIEGPNDTILRSINKKDGKVCIESSLDEGQNWKAISTIEQPDVKISGGYFSRLSKNTLLLTIFEGSDRVCWVRSDDGGRTWSKPAPIMSLAEGLHGYGPVCVMQDGRWAYCPYYERETKESREFQALLVWSSDRGKSWGKPIAFATPEDGNRGLTECTVVQLGPDNFLAAIRADESLTNKEAFDGFYLSSSKDGLRWSTPVSLGERGRMPLFYRIGNFCALAYRLYDCPKRTQHSAVRFSKDGKEWSSPLIIESGVNAGPQLVQIGGKLIALNNLYPNRSIGTRNVVTIPDWVKRPAMPMTAPASSRPPSAR